MKTKILTITILTTAWIAQAGATAPGEPPRTLHKRHAVPVAHASRAERRTTHRPRAAHRVHVAKREYPRVTRKRHAVTTPSRRSFRTREEYRRIERHPRRAHHSTVTKHIRKARFAPPVATGRHLNRQKRYVGHGWYVDERGQYDEQYTDSCVTPVIRPRHRRPQKAFRYYRRQWYLTYLWEHAPFVDQYGYFYGTFDTRGFYFEGKYYRYDRNYTYQDRLHGKGMFEHRFYRPRRHHARRHHADGRGHDNGIYVEWSWRKN